MLHALPLAFGMLVNSVDLPPSVVVVENVGINPADFDRRIAWMRKAFEEVRASFVVAPLSEACAVVAPQNAT